MTRTFNFSAGPAAMPEAVLKQAQAEMLDYQGTGMSVMEMSHRSKEFIAIAERAEQELRSLLAVPDNYKVLFLQGGATAQFAMVPLNLLRGKASADYVNTGSWAKKAIAEAKKFCDVQVIADANKYDLARIPEYSEWQHSADPAYLHITLNETIGGLEFHSLPDAGDTPLVADASSNILSRPLEVDRFGVIYAGAQKNMGPSGITVAIVRDDLVGHAPADTPSMLDYAFHADADSMANTPPTYAWYLAGLVYQWVSEQGGVAALETINRRKAAKLYDAVDSSNFYACPVEKPFRSLMNVPFTLADAALDNAFLEEAEAAGLTNLKGHRSVGGMRASIYNAVPEAAVDALVAFMGDFEHRRA